MPRVYGYNETKALMHEAADFFIKQVQVLGVGTGERFEVNPYVERRLADRRRTGFRYFYSPVGAVMSILNIDIGAVERISSDHIAYCQAEECYVCDEEYGNADTSLYAPWVMNWLRIVHDVEFTDDASDLLWEAETSGLPLYEFVELLDSRVNA